MKIKKLAKIIDGNQNVQIIEPFDGNWQTIHNARSMYETNEKYGEMKIKKIRPSIGNVLEIEVKRENK